MNLGTSHKTASQCLVAWVFVLSALSANAETIAGLVVSIADGDTITLLDGNNQQSKIRLGGIDAPERGQPFGNVSRQRMAELAFGKEAVADCYKIDRNRRLVCTVYVDGKDVGLAQLDAGLAWWFRKYANGATAARATYL